MMHGFRKMKAEKRLAWDIYKYGDKKTDVGASVFLVLRTYAVNSEQIKNLDSTLKL